MARLISGLRAERVRANLERVRSEIAGVRRDPDEVEILAAVKYVPVEELGVLAEAGIELLGENRVQDLARKADAYPGRFTWDFIGHLQSRKAPLVSKLCELCHSLDSESAARKLAIPALVEVNLSGESTKSGVAPADLPRFLELYPDVRGLMTMPPATSDPDADERRALLGRDPVVLARPHRQLAEAVLGRELAEAAEERPRLLRVGGRRRHRHQPTHVGIGPQQRG